MQILLPVSRGASFALALRLATDTAKVHGGSVRVLGVVDAREIRRVEAGARPGAIHLALRAAEEVRNRLTEEEKEAVIEAVRRCEDTGVPSRGDVREGEVEEELVAASGASDLLVSAVGSHFAPELEDAAGRVVLSVMRRGGIPVLLAGSPYRPVRTVVVGCGGGVRTERAVGAMTRLSLWRSVPRGILLAVDETETAGRERIAGPRRILADAGYPPWEETVLPGPRGDAVLSFCDSEQADLVVLGGWGEHRWDDLLGLSITGRLLEDARRHLFLYM